MNLKYVFLSIFFLLQIFTAFGGGGWTHDKGSGFAKIGQWWVIADQHYDASGTTMANSKSGVLSTTLYAEYGITDRIEALIYFPIVSHAFEDITPDYRQTITSMGDTDIGLKYAILKNTPVVLSSYLWLGLPLGNDDGGDFGYLQTGDGQFNQVVGLVASSGGNVSEKINLYGSIGADFNHRGGDYSDEWRINLEIGAVLFDRVILGYKMTNLKSLDNGTDNIENPIGGIYSNNREYAAFTYEVGVNLSEQIGITATYAGAYSAKNIFARPAYSAGVYFNF